MLVETALVVAANGNKATVKTYRGDACASCSAGGACSALGGGKEMEVEVLNHMRAKPGDRVQLALQESSFVKASAVTFMIPLVSMVGGAVLGSSIHDSLGLSLNAGSILTAAAGLGLSGAVVAWFNRRLSWKEEYIPRVIGVLPPGEATGDGNACQT